MSHSIGILALQGGFSRHASMLHTLGVRPLEVRTPKDLKNLKALIIPGGESTVISKLLVDWKLLDPLKEILSQGLPVWGTCAGLILMAEKLTSDEFLPGLHCLSIQVARNDYGRQKDSFEAPLKFSQPILKQGNPFPGVFIRAPRIVSITDSDAVEVLGSVNGYPVLVRQNNLLGSTFHPELTGDNRIHAWFLGEICKLSVNL